MAHDPMTLPDDLPAPEDDGGADHLPGAELPDLTLPGTDGSSVSLADLEHAVVFTYPRTGQPGVDPLVEDWDLIPGARGCTPETCAFRDLSADFGAVGVALFGLSTQDTAYQREAAERLRLPFPLLSDADLARGVGAARITALVGEDDARAVALSLECEVRRIAHLTGGASSAQSGTAPALGSAACPGGQEC